MPSAAITRIASVRTVWRVWKSQSFNRPSSDAVAAMVCAGAQRLRLPLWIAFPLGVLAGTFGLEFPPGTRFRARDFSTTSGNLPS